MQKHLHSCLPKSRICNYRLQADTKYKDYTLLLGEKPQMLLNSYDEDAQKLGLLLNLVQSCLFRIKNHFINIFFQYFNIDQSDLDYRQRKFLIETLNRFNYSFKNLYDEIKSNTKDGILLSSFRLFTCINGKTIIRTKMTNFDAITSLYERVEEINKKYI